MMKPEYTKDELEFLELMKWALNYMKTIKVPNAEDKKKAEEIIKENLMFEQTIHTWAEKRTIAHFNFKKSLYHDLYTPHKTTCDKCSHTAQLMPIAMQADGQGLNYPVFNCEKCSTEIIGPTPILLADKLKLSELIVTSMKKKNAPEKEIEQFTQLIVTLKKDLQTLEAEIKENKDIEDFIAAKVADQVVMLTAYKHKQLTGKKSNEVN